MGRGAATLVRVACCQLREESVVAKCDLCNENCKPGEMSQLLEGYQVQGIVDICQKCKNWADKEKGKLLDAIAPKLRIEIETKARFHGKPKSLSWWRRN